MAKVKDVKTGLNDVHFFVGHKGGIGKSYVCGLFKQYLMETGVPARVLDLDPSNNSIYRYEAYKAERYNLFNSDKVLDPIKMDEFIEVLAGSEGTVLCDFGASSMSAVWAYTQSLETGSLLRSLGKRFVQHVILTGGGEMVDTFPVLREVCRSVGDRSVVVWLNTRFGKVAYEGKQFHEMGLYEECVDKIIAVIDLPELNATTAERVKYAAQKNITLKEIDSDPDFGLMAKQRVSIYRRLLFEQIGAAWALIEGEPVHASV